MRVENRYGRRAVSARSEINRTESSGSPSFAVAQAQRCGGCPVLEQGAGEYAEAAKSQRQEMGWVAYTKLAMCSRSSMNQLRQLAYPIIVDRQAQPTWLRLLPLDRIKTGCLRCP